MANTEPTQALAKPATFINLAKLDPVIIGVGVIIAVLLLVDTAQAPASIVFTLEAIWEIAPFFLLSIGIAAYAKASGAEHLIAAIFAGNPIRMIVLASFFGALSPFCSCGVIPLVAGLLTAGVPLAPVMAFWLSSPLMSPESFILTAAAIGMPFALFKTLTAIGLGLVGGLLTHLIQTSGGFSDPLRIGAKPSCCGSSSGAKKTDPEIDWKPWRSAERRSAFLASSGENGWFLGRWLTLAFLIESLMVAYIPAAMISQWLGGDAWWSIPLSVGVGVPAYMNGFAAIPLISGLIEMGMMPGAAMGFMVAGGVTSIPAAIAVFALAKKPLFGWYIALSITGALASGLLYQGMLAF